MVGGGWVKGAVGVVGERVHRKGGFVPARLVGARVGGFREQRVGRRVGFAFRGTGGRGLQGGRGPSGLIH